MNNANGNRATRGNANTKKLNSAPGIITFLFQLQIATKMFHWQTRKYAEHVAAGDLYDALGKQTDEIIEMYMGTYTRPRMPPNTKVVIPNVTRADMVDLLRSGITYLAERMPRDAHIRNACDELAGTMAKVLYLLSLE